MLSVLSATAVPWAYGPWFGFPFFFFIPLLWILVIALLFAFFGRRARRRWGAYGPWSQGQGRSGESVLAERFANGDIDEVEYRARLEVLRANREQPR